MIIYKVTNLINNKVYIGLTTRTFEERKKQHLREAINSNSKKYFHNALRKYGNDNFIWEIIDVAETQEELNEKEIYWISLFNSYGKQGYNQTRGGEGASGYKHSDESRKKMSKDRIGRTHSEDSKKMMSMSQKGRVHSKETKMKIGKSRKGSKHPLAKLNEESVLEIKELIKNRMSLTEIAKIFNVNGTIVVKIKNGETWKHVGEDVSDIQCRKLTEEDVKEIKNLLKKGQLSQKKISEKYGVSKTHISQIKRGIMWDNVGEDVSDINCNAKVLNEEKVREIKILLKENKSSQKEIAEMYGVQQVTISKIKLGKTWRHVS